uniref:Putative sulfotransferase n=1 Tax=Amblyomma aureolatum TaxID=187763 RepID=A0A1E1XIW9_9ACAR
MDEGAYRDVDGVWLHSFFREETIRSAIKYKPRDGDIITVTYPKCGTNWTQFIIWNILTRAKPCSNIGEFILMCPFIDVTGAGPAEDPSRIGSVVTHLPMSVFKPVERAKYIYVSRNPYDCAVSFYHFVMGITPKTVTDVSFERFLSLFLDGKVMYGDYFDHLLPWYERRHDANILFITYEELKEDTRKHVLRIGDFLGKEHGDALRKVDGLLDRVMEACSLENMKVIMKDKPQERAKKMVETAEEKTQSSELFKNLPDEQVEMHEGAGFVRKGIVGDWKNYFTPDQIEQMKAWIGRKTQGSDVMTLWKDCGLP